MTQRIVTGIVLIAAVAVLLYFGGLVAAAGVLVVTALSLYEEYRALGHGRRVVTWPTWVALAISPPMMWSLGGKALIPITAAACMLTLLIIIFRDQPDLEDVQASLLPLLAVVLPGLCMESAAFIEQVEVQRVILLLMVAVPVLGDTMALFVGCSIGKTKLCPQVSPNKTVAGAVGGFIGSLLASGIIALVVSLTCSPELKALMPQWWTYIVVGLVGGAAAQIGDLFASMIKRSCGIKDFSNIFPGHGGMMDRMDSVFFTTVVVYCVRLMGTGI